MSFHFAQNVTGKQITVQICLIFVDPCIIVQFTQKMQQDATVYKNLLFHIYMKLNMFLGETPPIIRSLKLH